MLKRLKSPIMTSVFMLAALLSVSLILVSYWFWYVKPQVLSDSKTQLSAIAVVQAEQLAQQLESMLLDTQHSGLARTQADLETEISKHLARLLIYVYEADQAPLFSQVSLELATDLSQSKGILARYELGDLQCRMCYQSDYPLYSTRYGSLLGVASFSMPSTRIDQNVARVQNMFLIGLIIVLAMVAIALWLVRQLMFKLSRWNDELSEEVAKQTQSLREESLQHTQTQTALNQVRDETLRLERARIASHLETEISQALEKAKLIIDKQIPLATEQSGQRQSSVAAALDSAQAVIKNLCAELKPVDLEGRPLSEALYQYADSLQARIEGLTFNHFFDHEQHQLSPIETEQLYLIATELINTAIKHSKATHIELTLLIGNDRSLLRVADNGVGMINAHLHAEELEQTGLEPSANSTGRISAKSSAKSSESALSLHLVRERCARIGARFFLEDQSGRYAITTQSQLQQRDQATSLSISEHAYKNTALTGSLAYCVLEYPPNPKPAHDQ